MQKPEAKYKELVVVVLKEFRKEWKVTQRELASFLKLSQIRIVHLESSKDGVNTYNGNTSCMFLDSNKKKIFSLKYGNLYDV
tara:strand:- start:136 stop:381 length:246 start_codon:yes stop_codon:yes gene_type:complete